ncbi:MAG: DotH/IcmK family type IV secretion protein, partial [Deltaproteobacteria bacterium]|nr:DotH/IcmK family type IV secretion protein [Deltaproteobacteria bacterium]
AGKEENAAVDGRGEATLAEEGGLSGEEELGKERKAAYEQALEALLPSSPDEVRAYRRSLDAREEAMADWAPSALRSRTERVRLEPGFNPPLVELSPNLVTALVFTDSTGSPWPVVTTVLGSGNLFSAQLLEGQAANQVIVAPLSSHGHSNLVVSLKGKDIPLIARLSVNSAVSPDRQLDGLIIFQVQESGPLATPMAGLDHRPASAVDDLLYQMLDGITPEGSKAIKADPALEGESFTQIGPKIYLRTTRGLLWPAPIARVSGPGGVAVYEIPAVSSVMLHDADEALTVFLQGVETSRGESLEAWQ